MEIMEIKPSQTVRWDRVDQSKANMQCVNGHPDWYHWYEKDGIFHAHRIATIDEIINDKFH